MVGGTIGTVGGIANNAISTTGGIVGKLIDNSQSQQGTPNGPGTPNSQGTPGLLTGDVQKNDGYAGRSYGGYGYPPNNTPNYNTTTYPYYGAVPSTSNNYMPITTSFSAFGK